MKDLPQSDFCLTPTERNAMLPKKPKRTGHVRPSGTGPQGETCKTCKHIYRIHRARTFIKCALAQAIWTCGPGSDIRAGDPACERWEKAT